MKDYKNKFGIGYHSPELTLENITRLINQYPALKWQDTSWHNDLCDSITFTLSKTKSVQVWLPNSVNDIEDNEEINVYFFIAFDDDSKDGTFGEGMDLDGITCKTYEELITKLTPFLS